MKVLITIILFLFTYCCWADSVSERERAKKHIQRAVLEIPKIKKIKRNMEKMILKKIPVDKDTLTFIGSAASMLQRGKVDTKIIKHININFLGGDMRPDLMYNFEEESFKGQANINWSF